MTDIGPELRAMLGEWLVSGTEAEKAHARHVLSLPPPAARPPSFGAMARGLASTMIRFARSGFRISGRIEARRRLAICNDCDRRDGERCGVCGCYASLKAMVEVADCPLGRWTPGELKQAEKLSNH
jgi:hypothetical protein